VVKEARREYNSAEANSHLTGYMSEVTQDELDDLSDEATRPATG